MWNFFLIECIVLEIKSIKTIKMKKKLLAGCLCLSFLFSNASAQTLLGSESYGQWLRTSLLDYFVTEPPQAQNGDNVDPAVLNPKEEIIPEKILTFVSPENGTKDISNKTPITFLFADSIFALQNPETVQNYLKSKITITPAHEGSWQILGTSGILFEPAEPWANSTHYTINIPEEIGLDNDIIHEFETPRIKLQSVQSYDLINQKPLTVNFSQNVELTEVIKINFSPTFDFDVEYTVNNEGIKNEKSIKIIPRKNWAENKRISMVVPQGFASKEGPLKLASSLSRSFKTIDQFRISKSEAPEDVFQQFMLRFTTPLTAKELSDHLEILPSPDPEVWAAYLERIQKNDYERNYFRLPPIEKYWNPNTAYEVKISKDLSDKYGRTLPRDFSRNFKASFPTTFREVFLPSNNSVLRSKSSFKPTFWYSGNITSIEVVLTETLTSKQKITKNYSVLPSPKKESFWEVDLEKDFPEIFDEEGGILPGRYEMGFKAIKPKNALSKLLEENFNRYDRWWPQEHETTFYVSDFAVSMKDFPSDKFEVSIAEFPGDEPLSENFSYEIYHKKNYRDEFFTRSKSGESYGQDVVSFKPETYRDFDVVVKVDGKIGFGTSKFTEGIGRHDTEVSMNPGFYERNQKRFVNFSDKPLYKPGQKVYFKSIFRDLETKGKTFPLKKVNFLSNETFTIQIRDPRWNRLDPITVSGANGSFDGYWEIPADVPHGTYNFNVHDSRNNQLGSFQIFVGEYRKSNFLLKAEFDKKEAFYKGSIKMKANADFAFGGALKNRPVNYRVYLEGSHDCFWRFMDYDSIGGGCGTKEKQLVQGEGILDENGEFQKAVDLNFEIEAKDPVWNNLKFNVTVRDGDAEENSVNKSVRFYMSAEKITLDRMPYYFEKGTNADVAGKITDRNGKSLASKDLKVRLTKTNPKYRHYLANKDTEDAVEKDLIIWNKNIVSDMFGKFEINFDIPEKAGNYKITFVSVDGEERLTETSRTFWVPGVDDKSIDMKDEKKILPLILDKESYEIGDSVEIFMPHSEWQILRARATLERGEILEELPVNFENQTITLQTEGWMVPNVYVSVLLEGKDKNNNPKIKWGAINIPIEDKSRKLDISIIPDQENYRPGSTANLKIKTSAGGRAVPAELTVMIVDETLLSLKSRGETDLVKTFLAHLPLGISISHTVANLITQDQIDSVVQKIEAMELTVPEEEMEYWTESDSVQNINAPMARLSKGMMLDASMGMSEDKEESGMTVGSAGGDSGAATPRENFQDTAEFIGKLYTDADGVASFDFDLPDNLTTWNIYVVGHTENNEFGSKDYSVKTKLPLLISELVPNFFQMGDKVEVGLLIRRDVENVPSEEVEVTLDLPEGFTSPEITKIATVSDEARVFFPITISDKAYSLKEDFHNIKLGFSVKGQTTGLADMVVLERKLFPPKVALTAAEFLRVETEKMIEIKPDLDRAITSKVLIKVFLSLAEKLEAFVDVTKSRNYGCAEQRFSQSTSILVQKEFDDNLGRQSGDISQSSLKQNREYIEKAFVNGGGFAFWKHEERASFWVTAQILEFSDLWKRYGAGIDEQKIIKSRVWLKGQLLQECDYRANYWNCISDATRQNAGYTLAQSDMLSSKDLNTLSKHTHSLESKVWWLKSARVLKSKRIPLIESDQKRIALFWTEIESHLKARDRYVYWEENKDYWSFYSQNERLTSLIFDEILEEDMLPNYKHKIARYLSDTKTKDLSGNTALRLLQAVGKYAKDNEAGNLGAEYLVSNANALPIEGGTLPSLDSENLIEKDVTGDVSFTGLKFEAVNEKPFYADIMLQETFPAKLLTPVSRGFWLDRAIYSLEDEEMKTPLTKLEIGTNYVVRLKVVTNTSHRQIMLEDKIPSGSEFVNFEFENTNKELAQYATNGGSNRSHCYGWCMPTWDHKEFHSEKARFFANYLSPGTYEVKYIIKTRLPGQFEVLPAKIEEMYYPEVFATTKGESVTIER